MHSEQQLQARLITNVGLNESIKDSLQDAGQADWAVLFLLHTAHTIWKVFSKNTKHEKAIVFPATSLRPGAALCPNDLWKYCQSDLALSDTSPPLANIDSLLYNQSAQPSTQDPCHPARTPPKHLLGFFFFN